MKHLQKIQGAGGLLRLNQKRSYPTVAHLFRDEVFLGPSGKRERSRFRPVGIGGIPHWSKPPLARKASPATAPAPTPRAQYLPERRTHRADGCNRSGRE